MSEQNTHSSPIEFPCDFIIKVMGKNTDSFYQAVTDIVTMHYPNINNNQFDKRPSKEDTYLAITVTVHAKTKAELDELYQALSQSPEVIMAL
jgi:uncharacterized protein